MRRGQDSPADKSLKRPGREPWNGRKDSKVVFIITALTPGLIPGALCRLLIEKSFWLLHVLPSSRAFIRVQSKHGKD